MLKVGKYCKNFRMIELEKTLREVGGEGNFKTLSSFEHGRSTNINHLWKYVKACNSHEQKLRFIVGLLDIIVEGEENGWI